MLNHDIEQKSEEWFEMRKGKMTASHGTAIGNNSKGLETYILELMAEYYSSGERDNWSNRHTDRGNELEEQARVIYELETGNDVKEIGFVQYNEFVGCSPDGLVKTDGLTEIKCPDDKGYFKFLLNGAQEISSDYMWQMQMQMLITGRKWCDFVAYNPNYAKSIFIARIYADKDKQAKLLKGFEAGEKMIKEMRRKIDGK